MHDHAISGAACWTVQVMLCSKTSSQSQAHDRLSDTTDAHVGYLKMLCELCELPCIMSTGVTQVKRRCKCLM